MPLRKGVSSIFGVATESAMAQSLAWLDHPNADESIASTIEIARQNLRVPVLLVTRDGNLENKADCAGIPSCEPPDPPLTGDAG